jgi:hypothetical protein
MKSIGVKVLACLITFLIGWSCAKVRFTLLPRASDVPKREALKIMNDASNRRSADVVSRSSSEEPFRSYISWDGYVRRGRIDVRAGGSTWSVKGVSVSHTEEIYGSSDAARSVLSRFRGEWHSSLDVAPRTASCEFKVLQEKNRVRIAWVSGSDLHYLETASYSAAIALLDSWGAFQCS